MSFDRVAPFYRWLELFSAGNKLQFCRTAWLDQAVPCKKALIIGEGNGRFLAACAKKLPQTRFTVVDASAAMLRRAQARWRGAEGEAARVDWIHASLSGLNLPAEKYDLIVTHFFLDCFSADELPAIVTEIAAFAAPSCIWLLADFKLPGKGLAHWRARIILRLAYTFFRWTTGISGDRLVSPAPLLQAAGFQRANRVEIDWGLLYSDLWSREKSG